MSNCPRGPSFLNLSQGDAYMEKSGLQAALAVVFLAPLVNGVDWLVSVSLSKSSDWRCVVGEGLSLLPSAQEKLPLSDLKLT